MPSDPLFRRLQRAHALRVAQGQSASSMQRMVPFPLRHLHASGRARPRAVRLRPGAFKFSTSDTQLLSQHPPAFRPRIVPVLPQLRARARSARRALEPRANGAPAPAAAVRTVGMASGGSCSLPDEGEKLPPSAIAVACTAQGAGPGAAERSNALGGEY